MYPNPVYPVYSVYRSQANIPIPLRIEAGATREREEQEKRQTPRTPVVPKVPVGKKESPPNFPQGDEQGIHSAPWDYGDYGPVIPPAQAELEEIVALVANVAVAEDYGSLVGRFHKGAYYTHHTWCGRANGERGARGGRLSYRCLG